MTFSFSKLGALLALIFAVSASSAHAIEEFGPGRGGPGPGFNHGPGGAGPGFNRGPGFGPGFNRGPGFGPGFNRGPDRDDRRFGPGFGPGFVPGPGYGPGFVPGPGYLPGPGYGQGYVYTCFAVGNAGTSFYATGYDPNYTQTLAFQYCASSGQYCQATGCR